MLENMGFAVFRLKSGSRVIDRIFTLIGEGDSISIYSQRKVVYNATTYHEISDNFKEKDIELPYITNIDDNSTKLFKLLLDNNFKIVHYIEKSDNIKPWHMITKENSDKYKTIYSYNPKLYN